MNAQGAAQVLAAAAAYDQRTVGETDARAWAAALPDVNTDAALHAVVAWYARNPERIMPAHVRRLAVAAANDRHDRTPPDQRALPLLPDERATDDIEFGCRAWLGGWRQVQGEHGEPPFRLALAVAHAARSWAATGVGRTELARIMWQAGRDLIQLLPPGVEPLPAGAAVFRAIPDTAGGDQP